MNIACLIKEQAALLPAKIAVIHPKKTLGFYTETSITFSEFDKRSDQIAFRLQKLNFKKNERVLLFVKPKIDFSVITFALFKMGAIPVFIDPGMGLKNLLKSIEQVKPTHMIAEKEVHFLKKIKAKNFQSIKYSITPQELVLNLLALDAEFPLCEVEENDSAAILFTSGGTGIPKGVVTTHGILKEQTKLLKEMFQLTPNDVDLAGFSLFALFTLSMGMTSIIPDMDPTKPAKSNPKKLIPLMLKYGVTFAAGSPAIWENVGKFAKLHNIKFSHLKYLVMFGAPVRGELHELWKELIPFGTTYTPYGATESLPLTLMSGVEILKNTWKLTQEGAGVCVGYPVTGVKIKIIKITDEKVNSVKSHECEVGQPGEIIVSGKVVTSEYFEMKEETEKAKIIEDNILWHRMGDMGYFDHDGKLWFLGRKMHRVLFNGINLYPIAIEGIVNTISGVKRSALIEKRVNGQSTPSIVIESKPNALLIKKIIHILSQNKKTEMIKGVFFKEHFPVDVRHNIKIDRKKLSSEFSGDHL